jgi:hypothetical protein
MKKTLLMFLCSLLFISCEKENSDILIGNWQLVKGYDPMAGYYIPDTQDQKVEEYTKNDILIRYDFEGNEISRCNYTATNSTITCYGENLNGEKWSFNYDYSFVNDSLKIRHDGGFEYYDEFFIQIK